MDVIPSVKVLDIDKIFKVVEVDLKVPQFGKGVSQVRPRLSGSDSNSSRVIHCMIEDHAEWQRVISEKFIPQCSGSVVVFDCSYKWGNSGSPVVIIDEGLDDLPGLVNKMANINKLTELAKYQDKPLSLVVIQDLGIYHWKLRDAKKYDGLARVYQMCDQLATKYGCWVLTSNWNFF